MNPPKMPVHIGDYKRDTGHLRAAGHGAYLLLLFHHWSTGELPDDDEQLAAIACMTRGEWKKMRPILEKFFGPGWRHGRVEKDLASAKQSYEARAKAGEKGGKAKAENKQSSSIATALPEQPLTLDQGKKDSEADASGAEAPIDPPIIDHRKRLFNEGLQKLAAMTGKGPDACRSFVGKCLKAASDDAVVVLGLIEEAERNQAVDPSAWIAARLKPRENPNVGRSVHEAARNQTNRAMELLQGLDQGFDQSGGLCDGTGRGPVRLISSG